jgi:hypothetical protein
MHQRHQKHDLLGVNRRAPSVLWEGYDRAEIQHLSITRFGHFNGLADKFNFFVPQESLGNDGRPVS